MMRRAPWVLLGLGVLAVAEIALLVWVAQRRVGEKMPVLENE